MQVPTLTAVAQAQEAVGRGGTTERESPDDDDDDDDDLELDTMTPDDDVRGSAGAPLLAGSRNYGSGPESPADGGGGEAVAGWPRSRDLGTWFMWALTFSAGISGLLFGYEYVMLFD